VLPRDVRRLGDRREVHRRIPFDELARETFTQRDLSGRQREPEPRRLSHERRERRRGDGHAGIVRV
jgi:hypothetical protein